LLFKRKKIFWLHITLFQIAFFFRLNCEENYNYNGNLPEKEDYLLFVDTMLQVKEKTQFHQTLTTLSGNCWCFKENLLKSVKQEAVITLKTCTEFLKACFIFQENIKKWLDNTDKKFIHPFDRNIISISGYTFKVCNLFFLNNYNLFGVNYQYTGNFVNTSRGEIEFATFKTISEPEKNWVYHYNNPMGQKTFNNHKVDLWSPDGTVYQFYGCEFHYHLPPDCTKNMGKSDDSRNFADVPFSELKQRDDKVKNELLTKFPNEVTSYKIKFECEWSHEKKTESYLEFKQCYEHHLNRPKHRLIPRTSVRSGKNLLK